MVHHCFRLALCTSFQTDDVQKCSKLAVLFAVKASGMRKKLERVDSRGVLHECTILWLDLLRVSRPP